MLELIRSLRSRIPSPLGALRRKDVDPAPQPEPTAALKVAGYSLVLMDTEGQVVWTREWDTGGVFEFGPRQRLFVFCGYTNYSESEAEISEYEVELMGEDGLIIKRFNSSFGDCVVVQPGESKHFQAEWVQN